MREASEQGKAVIVRNSLVGRGSVGGRASLFALEGLGFPVWFSPTVLLPWHPGHGAAARVVPPDALDRDLSLAAGGTIAAVLSGYFGNSMQIAGTIGLLGRLRKLNPSILYLCDPVLGDSGRFYVHYQTHRSIRDDLMCHADIVTPNRFELAYLAGYDYRSLTRNAHLIEAARALRRPEVVVTSAFAGPGEAANLIVTPDRAALLTHAARPSAPHGTGDLLAALYLGHRLGGAAPVEALTRATATTAALVERAAGADELPLAGSSDLLSAAPVTVRIAPAGHG